VGELAGLSIHKNSPEVPRILFVLNSFEPDAPNQMCFAVVRALLRGGYVPGVFALSRGGPWAGQLQALAVPHLVGPGLGTATLASLLRRFRPHLVHFHLARPTLVGLPIARAQHGPLLVATHHGSHEWYEKGCAVGALVSRAAPAVLSLADRVVAVSQYARTQITRNGVDPEKVDVIYNGVNTMSFSPLSRSGRESVVRELFPTDDPARVLLVGCAGNLRRIKGHHVFLAAAAVVAQQVPHARFVIWGDGPERVRLERQIAKLNLQGSVCLAGKAEDLGNRIGACDLFVQPSLEESFGLAAVEAMAAAVPVVVTDAGGLPEIAGDLAPIVPRGNSAALAGVMVQVLSNDAQREQLRVSGRQRALTQFSAERMCAAHLQLYSRMLAGRL